jgi:glucosylglycerate synthase
MARLLSDPAVQAEMGALGTADLVLGLPTVGPTPSAEAVGRAALQGSLGSMTTVVVHVDPTGSGEVVEALTRAVAPCSLVHLEGSGLGRTPAAPAHHDDDDAVRTVLAAGRQLRARGIVLLTPQVDPVTPGRAAALAEPVLKDGHGLVLPMYTRTRYEGTLTHALVVPLVRALWGRRLAHPMAEEFACSGEAAAAFLDADAWETDLTRAALEFWLPVAAIQAGLIVSQAPVGQRRVAAESRPSPLGATVGRVAGALFALAEQTEGHWLEVRGSNAVPASGPEPPPREGGGPVDPVRLVAGFRQGVRDLLEIWVRILAPETLADVLALGEADPDEFRFSDRLWARVVYDFLLAWRFRVAHRGHVAQSLAPLYLGRTASLVLETRGKPATAVAAVGERLARGFEDEKVYLVDRWQ